MAATSPSAPALRWAQRAFAQCQAPAKRLPPHAIAGNSSQHHQGQGGSALGSCQHIFQHESIITLSARHRKRGSALFRTIGNGCWRPASAPSPAITSSCSRPFAKLVLQNLTPVFSPVPILTLRSSLLPIALRTVRDRTDSPPNGFFKETARFNKFILLELNLCQYCQRVCDVRIVTDLLV